MKSKSIQLARPSGELTGAEVTLDSDRIWHAIREVAIGENPDREGPFETPSGVARAAPVAPPEINRIAIPSLRCVVALETLGEEVW